MTNITRRLWEYEHPYYCNEDGYYYNASRVEGWGAPASYESFSDFLEDGWGTTDLDMNLVFRWDWSRRSVQEWQDDYGDDGPEAIPRCNSSGAISTLTLFLMMQRKGCKKVITIKVMEDSDEPAVREFLTPRWEHMRKLWEGIST